MCKKVLLIVVDGMRPDAILLGGGEAFQKYYESGTYCLTAKTTSPSFTLANHMSLFHSVGSERHGVTGNVFVHAENPVNGLVEVLADAGKKCAFFHTWEQLRDMNVPGNRLEFTLHRRHYLPTCIELDTWMTEQAAHYILELLPDFAFLYLGAADLWGHETGWMGKEYIDCIHNSWKCIERICSVLPEEYAVIVTADHGGHDYHHRQGTDVDMTIPITIHGVGIPEAHKLDQMSIKDIAPTITYLLGVAPDSQWEGRSVLISTKE